MNEIKETTVYPPPSNLIVLRMFSSKYADLSSFSTIMRSKRSFLLYKWDPNAKLEDSFGYHMGTYVPWVYYTNNKWARFVYDQKKLIKFSRRRGKMVSYHIMQEGHLHFKNEQELKDWLGEEFYTDLICDMIKG